MKLSNLTKTLWTTLILLFLNDAYAQTSNIYTLSIRDKKSNRYFDIHIDSLILIADTTMNFQMIPNLELEETLNKKYASFLELLVRITNTTEIPPDTSSLMKPHSIKWFRWSLPIDYQLIDINLIGPGYDEHNEKLETRISEYNLLRDEPLFNRTPDFDGSTPRLTQGWNFDYRFDANHFLFSIRNITKQNVLALLPNGSPKVLFYDMINAIEFTPKIDHKIAEGFLRGLLLNRNVASHLLNEDGTLSQIGRQAVKVLYNLDNGYDFAYVKHELNGRTVNRTPIASFYLPPSGETSTEIPLITHSIDPDGEIQTTQWETYNGDPSDNTFRIIDPTSANAKFIADYPGFYNIRLILGDNEGAVDTLEKSIEINHKGGSPYAVRGASLGIVFNPNRSDEVDDEIARNHFRELKRSGYNMVQFVLQWYVAHVDSNRVHPIYYTGDPEDPRGQTPSDDQVRRIIRLAKEEGLQFYLKPTVEVYLNRPSGELGRNRISPREEFFKSYTNFILYYARLAEEEGVNILGVGAETTDLQVAEAVPYWDALLDTVSQVFSGELTYDQLSNTVKDTEYMRPRQFFPWNHPAMERIGLSWFESIADNKDASTLEMYDNVRTLINTRIRPLLFNKYEKPIVFWQIGFTNRDGDTVEPLGTIPAEGTQRDDREQRMGFSSYLRVISDMYEDGDKIIEGFNWWGWPLGDDERIQRRLQKFRVLEYYTLEAEKEIRASFK